MKQSLVRVAVFTAIVALACAPAFAGAHAQGNITLNASMHMSAVMDVCSNNPGPTITINGELSLGGLDGLLRFTNNLRGTHTREEPVTTSITILDENESISFNKQPVLGGVGGNPWIYIQLLDANGDPLSDEVLLGRCVQGLDATLTQDLLLPAFASAEVTTGECLNSPGPYITLVGELALGGVDARLIFRNNERGTHEREEAVTIGLVIIPEGDSIQFAKSPHEGGVGGNPHIFFGFVDADAMPLTEEVYLGRCNRLD